MKIRQKFITFVIAFLMVLSVVPILSVQAATVDFKIISDSKVTANQAKQWAKSKGATQTFIDLADLYFKYSPDHGDVNPAIAYVQAAKETGYGNFGGVLDESYHNPCGLKNPSGGGDTDPNAHKRFDSWDKGVQAHLDHLALYAGVNGYPREDSCDPRQFQSIKGTVTTVNALGGIGKWAPSDTYGEEVTALYKNLMDFSGVDYPKDTNDTSKNDNINKNNGQSSNGTPNPGIPGNKPNALSISAVIPVNITQTTNSEKEVKPTITSTIGWKNDNGKWYYFSKEGKIITGWFKDNNNWYYLQGDGSMVTSLKKIDNKNYMFNTNGIMQTGWVQLNNYWYYFNTDGSMATGWILDNGNYYYLYDTGAMAKGWINLNGVWYHLEDSGAMTTGWITSNGDSYYLDDSTGKLLTNTTVDGYKIGTDGKRQASSIQNSSDTDNPGTSSSSSNNTSNSKKTIVIDPGHDYGSDYGAESPIDGVTYSETVLNMQVADKLKTELQNRGYNVIMTRNLGEQPSYGSLMASLTHRVDMANKTNADFFISIHHNSASATAQGVLSLYSQEAQDDNFGGKSDSARIQKSKQMASIINNNIATKLNLNNRGGQEQNLFVCRNTNMPAVLVEVGFITNKEEALRCANPASQQKVAEAIAESIYKNI